MRETQLTRLAGSAFGRLSAARTDPPQAPARALAALGVHRPLEIANVGLDGDACRCGMHCLDLRFEFCIQR